MMPNSFYQVETICNKLPPTNISFCKINIFEGQGINKALIIDKILIKHDFTSFNYGIKMILESFFFKHNMSDENVKA